MSPFRFIRPAFLAQLEIKDEDFNIHFNRGSFVKWSDEEAKIRIPDLPLAESMRGTIQLILANGQPVSEISVVFAK